MRKINFFTFTLMVASLMFILAACGGDDSSDGGGKGTKIAIGPPASETNSITKVILEQAGIEEGDYQPYQEAFSDAADLVQDGNIDMTFGVLGLPAANVESLQASTGDVVMLGMSDDLIEKMEAETEYERYVISEDSYDFLDSDIDTIAAFALLMGNTDTIDEELGYDLAKMMVEKAEEVTHAQGEELTLENALNGAEDLPIHPGAKKYYEEQGLTVDNPVAELSATKEDRQTELTIGTGSQGGTYYPLGGEIANVWNDHLDINVTNVETGATVENLATIGEGSLDLGMAVNAPSLDAVNGEGDFEGNQLDNVAFIGHIYPEVVQIVTRESTGITSLDDIK